MNYAAERGTESIKPGPDCVTSRGVKREGFRNALVTKRYLSVTDEGKLDGKGRKMFFDILNALRDKGLINHDSQWIWFIKDSSVT